MACTRKQRRIAIAVLIAISTVLLLYQEGLFSPEPAYAGKPLSYWCAAINNSRDTEREEAVQAIRAMGADAVKILVKRAFREATPNKLLERYENLKWKLPDALQDLLPEPDQKHERRARTVLFALEPSAKVLLPLLTDSLQCADRFRRIVATDLLGAIGEGVELAVPVLVNALKDQDSATQQSVVKTLASWPLAIEAVPKLLRMLESNDFQTWQPAFEALLLIVPENRQYLPILLPSLLDKFRSEDQATRAQAAAAIACIEPQQPEVLEFLFEDTNRQRHVENILRAIRFLSEMGPGAYSAIPVLQKAFQDENEQVRLEAGKALKQIQSRAVIPVAPAK